MSSAAPISHMPSGRRLKRDIKEQMREDLTRLDGFSRENVCDDISVIRGVQLSKTMLDKYVNPEEVHELSLSGLPAWTRVTGSKKVLRMIVEACGYRLATEEDMAHAQIGRGEVEKKDGFAVLRRLKTMGGDRA